VLFRSDAAISLTKDIILTYDNSPILAYYHSTCGGKTAAIEQVWDSKPALPYLKTIDDTDSKGKAFCSASSYIQWKEEWTKQQLSSILTKYADGNQKSGDFRGTIKKMKVHSRFPCGRIKDLTVSSTGSTAVFSGDKIRFAFRQNSKGYPILPSARFEFEPVNSGIIRMKGSGYGHGVGLCQMGAIGRALAGQTCEEILKAYYAGVTLVPVSSPEQ
jgi:stage II sporulation protein D